MKLIDLKCPNCHSNMKVGDNSKIITCEYCGTEILVDDEVKHVEYHEIYTDEAEIKKQEVKDKINERKTIEKDKKRKDEYISIIFIFGICFLMPFFLMIFFEIEDKLFSPIEMPESYNYYIGKDYKMVSNELKDLGFKKIELREIDDIKPGNVFIRDGEVESVSIKGIKKLKKGDEFNKRDKVVITYHTYSNLIIE